MAQAAKITRIFAGYVEIKKLIESASYSKIVKVTNKIINDDSQQSEAWQCKVVALIQMDQFKEANSAIHKSPNSRNMQFESAYCLYRLNDVSGALTALHNAKDKDSQRAQELRAQIYYRLEQYNDCYSVYRDLVRITDDDLDMERTTNMAAVQVHRTMLGECSLPDAPSSSASYEQWYNSGCAATAAGNTVQAKGRLQQAMEHCQQLLQEDGASEAEVQQEQAIIRVQRGYALQLEGRDKEAAAEYNAVLQHKQDDPALLAILHNNMTTIQRDGNTFESRKKVKAPVSVQELEHKLTSVQRHQLTLNNCIQAYYSQQLQQEEPTIISDCGDLISRASPPIRLSAVLLLAASLAKAGKVEQAVDALHQYEKEDQQQQMRLKLTATQIRLMKNDVAGAISELTSLPPTERNRPGVVASVVTLLTAKKQKAQITHIFKEAANFYENNETGFPRSSVEAVLQRASDHHLKEEDPRAAAAALEHLRRLVGDACLPALINAYSQFDCAKAQVLSREVPLPTEILSFLDADALEASLGPKYFLKAALKQEDKENSATVASSEKTKIELSGGRVKPRKKKKRKTVLPASYVAGQTPDPERWLPRWQRKATGGRRKRDKRKDKEAVGRGTQGGIGDTSDKYDITKNPGQYKSSSLHQQSEPTGPRRNMPKRRNKKK